jgi:hypothetical protein
LEEKEKNLCDQGNGLLVTMAQEQQQLADITTQLEVASLTSHEVRFV